MINGKYEFPKCQSEKCEKYLFCERATVSDNIATSFADYSPMICNEKNKYHFFIQDNNQKSNEEIVQNS